MKILIIAPAFNPPHGGLRIIGEWCNRLTQWHDVTVHSLKGDNPDWFSINKKVNWMKDYNAKGFDVLIITSPHSIECADRPDCPPKVFLFMQMAEHLFKPRDHRWRMLCEKFYRSTHPMFCISQWNIDMLRDEFGRVGPCIYIGNGVNLEDFPIEEKEKDGKTILVEGWECGNPSKDSDNIGPKVAARLKAEGFTILAYSHIPLKTMKDVPHEFHHRPSLEKLNELYSRATILIKASHYDARSCAPMEAMTKGTVTVRAIEKGDDDLSEDNSIIVKYDEEMLYNAAKYALAQPGQLAIKELSKNCLSYVQKFSWDYWMTTINGFIMQRPKVKTIMISVIYREKTWEQTHKDISEQRRQSDTPVVFVDREGSGSLAEAINRGFRNACSRYDFEYAWIITNVNFGPSAIPQIEQAMDETKFAAIHPSFDSDHRHLMKCARTDRAEVPFVEFTAACVRKDVFEKFPLDESMPYWGHDLDWGMRVRKAGYKIGVDYNITVEHTYIRNTKGDEAITKVRHSKRRNTDMSTRESLIRKYGKDWKTTTGMR